MVDNGDWGTDSGVLENYILTVEDAWFTTDARYNNGETLLLKWKGHAVDAETGEPVSFSEDEEEMEVSFPVGKTEQWSSPDGGKTAVKAGGRNKPHVNSAFGKVITRALADEKTQVVDGVKGFGIGGLLQSRGASQTEAKIWVGLKFLMRNEETNYGGEIGTKGRIMPVAFEGEADGGVAGSSATSTPRGETGTAAGGSSNKALEAKLTVLAKNSDSHSAFVDKALDIDGVADDEALLASVVDETNGLYSKVKANA